MEQWFAHPSNGVGTLGGWNGSIWLDFDVKQFGSQEDCERAVEVYLKAYPQLNQTFTEQTHSGGWRIGVKVKEKPNFTNFTLSLGEKRVGEALGEGRFTVLAPTIGPSGNSYRNVNQAELVEVETLESIGIYPSRKRKKQAEPQLKLKQTYPTRQVSSPGLPASPDSIPLEMLGTDTSKDILNGNYSSEDRSAALAAAIQEWYGWENWCQQKGIKYSGSTETLAYDAGAKLGIDEARVRRILHSVEASACDPAAKYRGGDTSC